MKLKQFTAPPFDPKIAQAQSVAFYWWSWNPNYPYWSKSCWGGKTEAEARKAINNPMACSMRLYHNKLIREGDGCFTEIADMPFNPSEA